MLALLGIPDRFARAKDRQKALLGYPIASRCEASGMTADEPHEKQKDFA